MGVDGIQDEVYGTSALNDGEWHTVRYIFTLNPNKTTVFEVVVDGESEKKVEGLHPSGIGTNTRRYGFLGDGSEAPMENGNRNRKYFVGDIRAVTVKASTWNPVPTEPT